MTSTGQPEGQENRTMDDTNQDTEVLRPAEPVAQQESPGRRFSKRTIWIGAVAAVALVLGGAGVAWALDERDGDPEVATLGLAADGDSLVLSTDDGDEIAVRIDDELAGLLSNHGIDATGSSLDDSDGRGSDDDPSGDSTSSPDGSAGTSDDVTAPDAISRASDAALAETGEGVIEEVERTTDGGYQVEVRLPDGEDVHLLLDGDFTVTGTRQD